MAQIYDLEQVENANESPPLLSHGVTGLKHNSGYIDDEFHPKLKGKLGRKKYREMQDNSPVVGASMWIIESLARQVGWITEANESKDPMVGYGQDFAHQCFDDMETPWRETVSETLSMIPFGWCALEPEFKLRHGDASDPLLYSKYDDGKYAWRDWAPRSQESLERWVYDATGRVVGMVQLDPNAGGFKHIPLDRLLLFRIRSRKNNPEGRSLFRTAFRPYFYATRHEEIESIGIERNIAGLPDYQVPSSVMAGKSTEAIASLDSAKTLCKKVRADRYAGIVRPAESENGKETGWKFQLISSSGKTFADSSAVISRYNTQMAQNFMTEFIMLGQGASSTSYSAHSDKTDLLAMSVTAILDIIDDVTNDHALPWLWNLNGFPRETMPTRKHGDIEKKAIAETFSSVTAAVASGAMEGDESVNNMLRRLVDLPPSEGRPMDTLLQEAALGSRNLGEVDTDKAADPDPTAGTFNDTTDTPSEPVTDPGDDGPEWWTVEEAAAELGVSTNVIRSAVRRGQIPGVGLGRTFRVNRKRIQAALELGRLG